MDLVHYLSQVSSPGLQGTGFSQAARRSMMEPPCHGRAGQAESLSWEALATHPVTHHIPRVKGGEGRKYFASQKTRRLLNNTGGRHSWKEKSDCKPEHPSFCWVFWSLTVCDHTESYLIACPCHYSVVCNLQPSEVIHPNFPHSRTTHERKVNLILERLVRMLWLTLALAPASNTGHNRALLSAKQHQHVKKNQWKQGEKNASGSVGLLKHSCTSELGKSTMLRKVPGEQRNVGVTFGGVSGLPLSCHFYWL